MLKLSWIFALALGVSSSPAGELPVPGRWFIPKTDSAKGIVLVIHGLNLKPSKMDSVSQELEDHGYEIFRMELAGHRGSLEEFRTVDFDVWTYESVRAYQLVSERAKQMNVPFHVIGFSLGGVMAQTVINLSGADVIRQPHSVVLFAPALSLQNRSYFIRLAGVMGSRFVVPSVSPAEYRAHRGTTMAGYYALFDGVDRLDRTKYYRSNVKTLVVVDPNDEVVSYSGLLELKNKFHLSRWKFLTLDVRRGSQLKKPKHHLIIDEVGVGRDQFQTVMSEILRTFE